MIKIKEGAEKRRNRKSKAADEKRNVNDGFVGVFCRERRNGKSKAADKKRNINDRFVGVFCRNSNPTADPPGTELLRRKNPDGNEMKKVRVGDNRHMVTCAKGN